MSADGVVREGLDKRYTGAVLRVERSGRVAFERAYGSLDDAERSCCVEVTTRFDLASLTKPFVASAALRAVAEGVLALDAPLVAFVPAWRASDHAPISLRMLLAHTSGMHSGADYRTLLDEDVEQVALERPLADVPGARVIYSDLGFIALGTILARARGRALGTVLTHACATLRCEGTDYRPRGPEREAIPATECDAWRGRLRGVVHDEKAYLMNGIAGHAGLFGTARDVAALAEAFLGPLRGRPSSLVPAGLVREAVTENGADPALRRGLGWALKTTDENSSGEAMSRATFGHTGFTGTSIWVDPERDLSVTLLTNSVFYGRSDLRELRAAVCDAAVTEFAP